MKRLKDFVEIDKRFQNSINLQLDLQDDTKLESYIPTKSSLLILQKYLKTYISSLIDFALRSSFILWQNLFFVKSAPKFRCAYPTKNRSFFDTFSILVKNRLKRRIKLLNARI